MLPRYERRLYEEGMTLWAARYRNLRNIDHYHDEVEIVFLEEGKADVITEDETYSLHPGQAYYIPQWMIHRIVTNTESQVITFLFSPEFDPVLLRYRPKNALLKVDLPWRRLFALYHDEKKGKEAFHSKKIEEAFRLAFVELFRKEGFVPVVGKAKKTMRLMQEMAKAIEEDYASLTFESLCKRFSYSPSHFSRLFESMTGLTFTTYLSYVRIEKAIQLLKGNELPMTEIASRCGFSSIRNFNRVFKKITSYSPTALPRDYELTKAEARLFPEAFDPTERTSIRID